MTGGDTKKTKYESVRIWKDSKKELEEVLLRKALKEKRRVTEVELVSKAVDAMCVKERRKLEL